MRLPLTHIIVRPGRQRQTYTQAGLDLLIDSMERHGQLNPLIVIRILENSEEATELELDSFKCDCGAPNITESNPHTNKCSGTFYILVAGERRLTAARELGWTFIEVKEKFNCNALELKEIELDENLCRENLSWQEEVSAKRQMLDVRAKLYGENLEQAAEHLNISKSSLWEDAHLATAMEQIPQLSQSKNKAQANNKLRLLEKRLALTELASRGKVVDEGKVDYSKQVLKGNCLELVKKIKDEVISLIITDPPYGIDLDKIKKDTSHVAIYDDNHTDIMELTNAIIRESFRILKPDAHMYLWFDIKSYYVILNMLTNEGFNVDPIPLIWVKNGPGQTNHPDQRWGSGYETCFFVKKGKRPLLKQGQSNVLSYNVVPPSKKIHPAEKPWGMIAQLIETSSVEGELVLDFFGGSGSTAEAAIHTKRPFILMELDEGFHAGILHKLSNIQPLELLGNGNNSDKAEVEESNDEEEELND